MHFASSRPKDEGILVLDYGSQYTLLIARKLREQGIYSEIVDGASASPPAGFHAYGLILSGGPDSVMEEGSRRIPEWALKAKLPILGICYGMQLLVESYGGRLRSGAGREYGEATLTLSTEMSAPAAKIFYGLPRQNQVWMSHGDDMEVPPQDFETIGRTADGVAAAMVHRTLPIIGLQFHPEVQHSACGGQLLDQFATELCKAPRNWQVNSMMDALISGVRETVGEGNVLVGCSGGVDSSVAAVLLTKALGPDKVTAVFIDNGLLRKDEVKLVSTSLRGLGLHLEVLPMASEFFNALKGLSDPEDKRKAIGRTFIHGFEAFAKKHKAFTHLGQGTLYPDVIESAGHGAGSKVIKSHHNVGGLPEKLHLKLVEPFRFLFKDEVRRIGNELGLPPAMILRHPFPGPGLGIRIPGEVSPEKVAILQEADAIFVNGLHEFGLYDQVWQAAAILLPVKSVGVMGDNRTYQWALSLRAVVATDAMTAHAAELPMSFLTKIADRIVRNVDGINRVLYDVTSKPPATIEWE
jgi:GMP synthase (glutamine-hydrolysing)